MSHKGSEAPDTSADTPASLERRRVAPSAVQPGGRRTLTLTLEQVAVELQTDVRTVKKLIGVQRAEDTDAVRENREPRRLGLRATQLSTRLTRVTEQELSRYLGISWPTLNPRR